MIDIFLALALIVVFGLFNYQMWHVGLYFGDVIGVFIVAYTRGVTFKCYDGDLHIHGWTAFKFLRGFKKASDKLCQS